MARLKRSSGDFIKLPESELQIMQLIWDMEKNGAEEISAGALFETYPTQIGHLKLTTVLTLISRLASRGYVGIEKIGRSNCYHSLVSEENYKSGAAADFVATVYKNNSKGLLSALWNNGILSEEDIAELTQMITSETSGTDAK